MKKQTLFSRLRFSVFTITILCFASVVLKSCAKDTTPEKVMSVQLATDATLGTYFTDGKGYTLYYFSLDIDGISKCGGGCLAVWPIFYDSLLTSSTLGAGLNASDFTTITATNGAKQTAYKGWPLYYYAPNVSGTNVREPIGAKGGEKIGNTWFVVKTNYATMIADKKVIKFGSTVTTDSIAKIFLTDSAGNTLYYFVKDSTNPTTQTTNCITTCAANWLPFNTTNTNFPTLLAKTDFSFITRTDGAGGNNKLQLTYKGRPLYYYAPDAFGRGVVKGEAVGNNWYVVKWDVPKLP